VNAEETPDRRQAAERLAAGEPVATFDAFCACGREQYGDVVAAFGVPRREHFTCHGGLEQPLL